MSNNILNKGQQDFNKPFADSIRIYFSASVLDVARLVGVASDEAYAKEKDRGKRKRDEDKDKGNANGKQAAQEETGSPEEDDSGEPSSEED